MALPPLHSLLETMDTAFENPVFWAIHRTLCLPWSQRQLKMRRLLAQNPMSVCALKGD